LIPEKKDYGHLHNLMGICRLLLTTRLALGEQEASLAESVFIELPGKKTMNYWTSKDWKEFLAEFHSLQEHLLRNDADRAATEEEDETTHPARGREKLYKGRLDELSKWFLLLEMLAPIRGLLVEQLEEGKTGNPKIPAKQLKQFSENISGLKDGHTVKTTLFELISEPDSTAKKYALKPLEDLKEQFKKRPYDLEIFSKKVIRLLRDWASNTFADRPALLNVAYNPDAVANLSRKRKGLRNQGGEDPKDEAIRLAAMATGGDNADETATTPRARRRRGGPTNHRGGDPSPKIPSTAPTPVRDRGHLYEKKKSAHRMEFTQDEVDDIEEYSSDEGEEENDANRSAQLSSLPSPAKGGKRRRERESLSPIKKKKSQDKGYSGRREWTAEETNAVKEGVRKLKKTGKWAEIKSMYEQVLVGRTSGQIKDKWRTLSQKGLVDDILEEIGEEKEPNKSKKANKEENPPPKVEEDDDEEEAEEKEEEKA
jgi:hypothetical protein